MESEPSRAVAKPRVSVVVLTHNRIDELERTLRRLRELPQRPPIIVVDNASSDDTAERVRARFPEIELVRCDRNLGAAGRNAGVERVRTPYVAFCDDDTWWAPGALTRAAQALDQVPRLAAVSARVLVGPDQRPDPTCEQMATSPLDATGLPGPALIGFMAGAVVMRCDAFREVGGYEPRLFIGAEETLMGLDLAARGWRMVYLRDVVTHHHPSPARDRATRRTAHARNLLWIAWLRLPLSAAWRETVRLLRENAALGVPFGVLPAALRGLPWVMANRRVLPQPVHAMYQRVHARRADAPTQPLERGA